LAGGLVHDRHWFDRLSHRVDRDAGRTTAAGGASGRAAGAESVGFNAV